MSSGVSGRTKGGRREEEEGGRRRGQIQVRRGKRGKRAGGEEVGGKLFENCRKAWSDER